MNLLETYFDRRAKHVVSNVGKVFGFSIGYAAAEGKGQSFGYKVLSGLGLAMVLGLAGRLVDEAITSKKTNSPQALPEHGPS